MSLRKTHSTTACIYCGATGKLTHDHIPPKGLFAKPRPSNLITVPSCAACNLGASKDDEYFRMVLCLEQHAGDHPDAQRNHAVVFKAIGDGNPQRAGLRRMLLNSIFEVHSNTANGRARAPRLGYEVDLARLDRVVGRVVRGLVYHEKQGHRLPDSHQVVVWSESGLACVDRAVLANLQQKIILPLAGRPSTNIGQGVFAYRFAFTDEDEWTSAWLLTFYGAIRFLSLTLPREAEK